MESASTATLAAPDCHDVASWNNATACGKVKDGVYCKTISERAANARECSGENLASAQRARDNAVSVLQSCLDLCDHVTITIDHGNIGQRERVRWENFYRTPGSTMRFTDQRYAFLTETRLKHLLNLMDEITFMEDNSRENAEVYAYVFPAVGAGDPKYRKVFLCNQFWRASDDLEQDSKIGTLIHEVSHLLGTHDKTYARKMENDMFELTNVDHRGTSSTQNSTFNLVCYLGKFGVWNANNVEYEFELGLRHTGQYRRGQWDCCATTEKFSVCYHRMHTFTPMLRDEVPPTGSEKMTFKSIRLFVDGVEETN